MGLLDELTGGGDRQQELTSFMDRYHSGAPHEGISDSETAQHYESVAGQVDPQVYQQSAQDSFGRMGENDRAQYAQQLQSACDQQGVSTSGYGGGTDPASLAALTTQVHQQNPGLLGSLLGGGGGGIGGLLGGGGGMLGGGGGPGGGGNPIMRAALGGISAFAMQRMGGGGQGPQSGLGGLLG